MAGPAAASAAAAGAGSPSGPSGVIVDAPTTASSAACRRAGRTGATAPRWRAGRSCRPGSRRSEEHTSELQSRQYLVCRLLLEKKKIYINLLQIIYIAQVVR